MFNDLLEAIKEFFRKLISSRIFVLGVVGLAMYAGLVHKLFDLQIIHGEEAQAEYMQLIEQDITTAGTRGNIYDRNGVPQAYNKLAYCVTVQGTAA